MERRARALSIFLIAGVIAVVATAAPLVKSLASPPGMQIQYTKVTSVKLPGILSMFGGGGKSTSETTTVSKSRMRTDNGGQSDIVACDLKKVIHLDNNAKTYYSETFDEIKAKMEAAVAQAQQQIKGMSPAPAMSAAPIQGSGGFTLSVNSVNDPNTQQILGMTARHVTETLTGTSTGTGECPNGSMSMTNDEWYVPNEVKFSCPLPRPNLPAMPNMPRGGGRGQNPCFGKFQMQAQGKIATEDRFSLRQDTTIDLGMKITTHEEVTSYTKQPYNPASFDVPSGYTQVPAPANR